MARIFITGSSDGLGKLAAQKLADQGHNVVLHGRNEARAKDALRLTPGAQDVVVGDLSDIDETIRLAEKVNGLGTFDAVIHNAGVYTAPRSVIFNVNSLAPYILTSLITKPKRLIYLSSQSHYSGSTSGLQADFNSGTTGYSNSKLHVLMLAKAMARHWPEVYSNAVDPGWVPTKMGGAGAPDDLQKGYETQVWLATSNEAGALVSGAYFRHQTQRTPNTEGEDDEQQELFLRLCNEYTGIPFPAG